MIQKITNKMKSFGKAVCSSQRLKTMALMLAIGTTATFAQNAAGDYTAGTTALSEVTTQIAKYIPYVVKLVYAIAGVVAVVGAISVYIKMNNEEQDVQNWLERIRKEVTNKVLSIKRISDFLIFPILAQPTLKKI